MVGEMSEDGNWMCDGTKWVPAPSEPPSSPPPSPRNSVILGDIVTTNWDDAESTPEQLRAHFKLQPGGYAIVCKIENDRFATVIHMDSEQEFVQLKLLEKIEPKEQAIAILLRQHHTNFIAEAGKGTVVGSPPASNVDSDVIVVPAHVLSAMWVDAVQGPPTTRVEYKVPPSRGGTPPELQVAINAMTAAPYEASDLTLYVDLDKFDAPTQVKLWQLWREAQAEWAQFLQREKNTIASNSSGGGQGGEQSVAMIGTLVSVALVLIGGIWLLGATGDALTDFNEAKEDLQSCIFCGNEEEAYNDAKTGLMTVCGMWVGFLILASVLPWGNIFD